MSTPPQRLPGDRGHLSRLLDVWARDAEARVTSGRLRRLVGVMAIIPMLEGLKDEEGRERIAFKGGAALELRFGFRARASNDLDGAYRGEVSEVIGLIDEGVRRGWSGFTGRTTEGEPILGTGLATPPVRFRVKLLYRDKDFVTVPMELSPEEGRSLDQVEVLPAAVSLAPVQLTEAESIPFLPIRYQVAQKLHACTEDMGEEHPNQRAGDLADILLAVPGNTDAVAAFRTQVTRLWFKALRRRSQRNRLNWERMNRIATRWLPPARVQHPFPNVRFDARTRGRSPVR